MNRLRNSPAPIMILRITAGRETGTAWDRTSQPAATMISAPPHA